MKDWQLESLGDGKERKKGGNVHFRCIVTFQVCVSGGWNNSPAAARPCWALQATEIKKLSKKKKNREKLTLELTEDHNLRQWKACGFLKLAFL